MCVGWWVGGRVGGWVGDGQRVRGDPTVWSSEEDEEDQEKAAAALPECGKVVSIACGEQHTGNKL
jgi:hypothetical protein